MRQKSLKANSSDVVNRWFNPLRAILFASFFLIGISNGQAYAEQLKGLAVPEALGTNIRIIGIEPLRCSSSSSSSSSSINLFIFYFLFIYAK